MSSIFISYRRVGALVHARALFERLRHEFGPNEVFIDLEGVDYGLDFIDILNEQLNGCQVMLAVIDPQWATATDRQGRRRLDREFDYVRVEIVTALARGIRTVPVLIDGAEMPDASELPEPLRPLTRRNALMLDFNRFDAEISRLIALIRKILAAAPSPAPLLLEPNRTQQQEVLRLRKESERTAKEADVLRDEAEHPAEEEEVPPLPQKAEREANAVESLRQVSKTEQRETEEAAEKAKQAEALRVRLKTERRAQETALHLMQNDLQLPQETEQPAKTEAELIKKQESKDTSPPKKIGVAPPLSPNRQGVHDRRYLILRSIPWWLLPVGLLSLCFAGWLGYRLLLAHESTQIRAALASTSPQVPYGDPQQPRRLHHLLAVAEAAGSLSVEDFGDRSVITLTSSKLFPTGSAELAAGFDSTLDQIAAALNQLPGRVIVIDHTDDRPLRSLRFSDNFDLSRTRAHAVAQLLEARLSNHSDVDWAGAGSAQPRYLPADTPENRVRNQRVEIVYFD